MLEIKVFVAPFLETRVQIRAEGRQRVTADAVKMPRIFLVAVVRREIHAAAEPEQRRFTRFCRDQQAHVHVHGGAVRIARMHDERHAHGLETTPGKLRTRGARRGWQSVAGYVGETDAATFEKLATFENPRAAAPAQPFFRATLPGIDEEFVAVERAKRLRDLLLQTGQISADSLYVVGWSGHRGLFYGLRGKDPELGEPWFCAKLPGPVRVPSRSF